MFKSLPRRALLWAPLLAVLLTPNAFAAGGGGGAGKVSYSDLSVMISLEKASPLLNLAVADGEHFDAVELTFRAPAGVQARAGDDKRQDYLKVTLEEVMVSSYQISGHTARLSINYARVANGGTGKTMAAEVLANIVGGANFALADGSVRFVR